MCCDDVPPMLFHHATGTLPIYIPSNVHDGDTRCTFSSSIHTTDLTTIGPCQEIPFGGRLQTCSARRCSWTAVMPLQAASTMCHRPRVVSTGPGRDSGHDLLNASPQTARLPRRNASASRLPRPSPPTCRVPWTRMACKTSSTSKDILRLEIPGSTHTPYRLRLPATLSSHRTNVPPPLPLHRTLHSSHRQSPAQVLQTRPSTATVHAPMQLRQGRPRL